MKKLLTGFLVLSMACFGAAQAAETDADTDTLPAGAQALTEGVALDVDLNGDGETESVSWAFVGDPDMPQLTLTLVSGADTLTYPTDICWAQQTFVMDLDGDGTQEIFLSGDVASDDYYTWCLRFNGRQLYPLLFADAARGSRTNGYYTAGYGAITTAGSGQMTLTGSQDVLGTWMAARTFTMAVGDRFELNDGGVWTMSMDMTNDDIWMRALKVKSSIDVTYDDGSLGSLSAGDQLLITASNLEDTAWFTTMDGRSGTLAISEDYDQGWGYKVNDQSESDLFEFIPYAD